ncbi:DMT family transporter [Paenibacillus thermoaerophilus]|uniref:DMT family transporter n=1 Tax=Paenibacillus thermoaerophilus TaxID=1215385 RepID=A0ABW2V5J6_9BACL|nr:DMT family transporter [Paenibacillus thermoaerophilus]TMV18408.1 DMT family transporter [Paenibacillus thermoaerophilus]
MSGYSNAKSGVWIPHAGFVLVYILWGLNMSSMKFGGGEWDPFVFNSLRYLLIAPILWLMCAYMLRGEATRAPVWKSPFRMERKDLMLLLGLGVLSGVGMEAFLSYGLQYSNTANGAVLGRGLTPVVTVLIALALRQLNLTWRILVGIPLAFVGVLLMVGGEGGFAITEETLKGDVILLSRSLFGAIYLIGMNRLIGKYPLPLLIAWEMTAAAVSLAPVLIWKGSYELFAEMSWQGWVSLAYTSIFATIVGFYIHNACLGRLGPFKASAYGYLLPLTAAVFGYLLLGERLSVYQWIGGAGVLTAMYLVQRDRMQEVRGAGRPMPIATEVRK